MTTGLTIHVGEDLVSLSQRLGELLDAESSAVLEPTWVVVPSSAVRQWLDAQLSQQWAASSHDLGDGISANIRFLFPEEFVRTIEGAALESMGHERIGWDVHTLSLAQLATVRPRPTYDRARRNSESIDLLLRWRSDELRQSAASTSAARDASSRFHELTALGPSPLDQRDHVHDVLQNARPATLPQQLFIFGLAAVPGGEQFVGLTDDLARHTRVDVLWPVPSVRRARALSELRTADPASPLDLWFRESDESLQLWDQVRPTWYFIEPAATSTSCLHSLQKYLRNHESDANSHLDSSVRIVSAVGRSRQVEVLRDLIFEAVGEGIAAHEVLVLSPDPAQFAHELERHWNYERDQPQRRPRLAYEMTEDDATHSSSRLATSVALLNLLGNYATREQLEHFCSFDSIRRKLDLDGSMLERIWQLADESVVTFGISAAQRAPLDVIFGADENFRLDSGTWERLIDRVAQATSDVWHGDSSAVGVPGDLDLVARLQPLLRLLDEFSPLRYQGIFEPLSLWLSRLQSWMNELSAHEGDESFERAVNNLRSRIEQPLLANTLDVSVSFDEFCALWSEMAASGVRQRIFGRRGVVVAPLTSLHFAPFKMICVVGFDDDLLPGATFSHPLLGTRRAGDPDPRHAVLASTLAACLSAQDRLVFTFSGRDDASGRTIEPPIALGELRDVLTTIRGEEFSIENSSRHGFAVSAADEHSVAFSYDERHVNVAPAEKPRRLHADDDDVTREELLEFLSRPAYFFVRRSLGADAPREPIADPTVPPITVDARHRAHLQRTFTGRLSHELHERFTSSATVPRYVTFDHDPSPQCARLECAWLHEPAWRCARDVFFHETAIASVPPRLWHHRLKIPLLQLAAYNFAVDLTDLSRREPSHSHLDLHLEDNVVLRAIDDQHVARSGEQWRDLGSSENVTLVNLAVRSRSSDEPRDLLRQCAQLMMMQLDEPSANVASTTYFLPERANSYIRKQDDILAGDFARNPYVTLRYSGSAEDARHELSILVALLRRARHEPVALFARTSSAYVCQGHKQARSAWESTFGVPGENSQSVHRLLFPANYDDLVALGRPQPFPFARELRDALAHIDVARASQSQRSPAQLWREQHPELWSGAEITPSFTAVLAESSMGQ
jgi:exonuclease V gamma subunit